MSTKKYPLETEPVLWELMSGTVPGSKTINEHFQAIMKEEIADTYTRSYLEASPKFAQEHLDRFDEIEAEVEAKRDSENEAETDE